MRTGGNCRTVDREISRFPRKERLHTAWFICSTAWKREICWSVFRRHPIGVVTPCTSHRLDELFSAKRSF
jgi:hypothetical protein